MKTPAEGTMVATDKESSTILSPVKRRKLFDKIVSLVVGPDKRVFTMHKGLLCSMSDYFSAALKGNFKEATEQSIEFPEDEPWIFERFQLWLYSEQVLEMHETARSLTNHQLVTLYAFAESRCIPNLQNHLVDLIIERTVSEDNMPVPCDGNMYTVLAPSSALLKLAVDLAAHKGAFNETWDLDNYPKQFLTDVIRVLRDLRHSSLEERDFWECRYEYHVPARREWRCSEDPEDGEDDEDEDEDDENDDDD